MHDNKLGRNHDLGRLRLPVVERPKRERDQQRNLVFITIALIVALATLLLFSYRPAGAQERTATDAPLSRYLTCGQLSLMLEEHEVKTWGVCEHRTQYVIGNCDGYQAFELTVKAEEAVKLRYAWYCNPPAYTTEVECADFPGTLHFRTMDKEGSTIEEWYCPS